jgi:hypothetical protein
MTKEQIRAVLNGVLSWPQEDQEELAQIARDIEARRKGDHYVMTDDERAAVADARNSPVVPEGEAKAFWKKRGIG